MRKILLCIFVLSLACLTVEAGDPYQYRDNIVWAWFDEAHGLIVRMIAYEVREHRPPAKGATTARLMFDVFYIDSNGVTSRYGGTIKDLLPGEFHVIGLQQARITTEVEVIDMIFGDSHTFAVDVSVTGIGPAQKYNYHDHYYGPNGQVNHHGIEVYRQAEAVGTVYLGNNNLTPNPAVFADLTTIKLVDVTVQ